MDFTLATYKTLLKSLQQSGYMFQPYADFLTQPEEKVVILRHDVDKRPQNSLVTAKIENELGIRGTYYFRIVPCSFHPDIIREIHSLGHEIGYHYEDLSLVPNPQSLIPDPYNQAILSFKSNLDKLRNLAPITTACMHGSPLSRYDNRQLWDHYSYRDYGIIGEPYFDTDFSKVLYLTDTGRTWYNSRISVRDKVIRSENNFSQSLIPNPQSLGTGIHKTIDIIKASNNNTLPSQIMITIHPQRWTSNPIVWLQELILQNLKNLIKRILVLRNGR